MTKIEILENGNVKLTIPMSFRHCAGRKRIIVQCVSVTLYSLNSYIKTNDRLKFEVHH